MRVGHRELDHSMSGVKKNFFVEIMFELLSKG
jgi:hypothetical protein